MTDMFNEPRRMDEKPEMLPAIGRHESEKNLKARESRTPSSRDSEATGGGHGGAEPPKQ